MKQLLTLLLMAAITTTAYAEKNLKAEKIKTIPLARVFRRITRVYKITRSVTGISNPEADAPLARVFRRITRVYKISRSVTGISNPEADANYKSLLMESNPGLFS